MKPAYTSISKFALHAAALFFLAFSATAHAQDDDMSTTPYTEYGEFNELDDEAENLHFFQYGRFFGVSLGAGYHGVTGNRALLWEGGFPMVNFNFHYWFDFNFALQFGFSTAPHNYLSSNNSGVVKVNLFRVGLDLKYYFDTTNLSAPISFASPYLLFGGGGYTKTESTADDTTSSTSDQDSTFGFNVGAGLEFPISHKKTYFALEGKLHWVSYEDENSRKFVTRGIESLSGYFYSVTGNFLFTW